MGLLSGIPGLDNDLKGRTGAGPFFISYTGLVFIFSALAVLALLSQTVYLAPRGFDLTDESMYLMLTADPWAYNLSVFNHGFFYHPWYSLADGDITFLRLANIGLTWLLFFGLAFTLVKRIELESAAPWLNGRLHRCLAAWLLTAPAQLLLYYLGPTPSYNTLCGQGLALSLWGLLLAGHQRRAFAVSGWVMLGLGGALTFMGKPSSALLLALGAALYILAAHRGRLPWVLLAVAAASAVMAALAFSASGSLEGFVNDYKLALQAFSAEEGTHSLKELLLGFLRRPYLWSSRHSLIFFAAAALSCAYVSLGRAGWKYEIFGELFLLALLGIAVGWVSGFFRILYGLSAFCLLAAPVGALLALRLRKGVPIPQGLRPSLLKFALLLLFMPYIFAFGTNNDYVHQTALASVFWLMAAVTLVAALDSGRDKTIAALKVMAAFSIFFICGLTRFQAEHPYRQSQPLWRQSRVITAFSSGRDFIVADDLHDYLAELQKTAAAAGFKKGDCLIDLTGHSPGAAYFLGAKAPGQPWLIGGYRDSRHWLTSNFDRLPPDDLKGCWVLLEPEGPRPNDPAWLAKYGLEVADMSEAGSVRAYFMNEGKYFRQILLKPNASAGLP